MKKHTLYVRLEEYLAHGYLQEFHSEERFSIFRFLDSVYVGFLHTDSEETDVTGGFLTVAEAAVISRCGDDTLIRTRTADKKTCLTFSSKILSRCKSSIGRYGLKRRIKKCFCHDTEDIVCVVTLPDNIPSAAGAELLQKVSAHRDKNLRQYRRQRTIRRILGAALILPIIGTVLVICLQKPLSGERSSVAFDKMSEDIAYSYVEADVLVPYAELSVIDFDNYSEPLHGTYFLYGNTQTGSYGLIKFQDAYEESKLFPDEPCAKTFDQPIRLYGTPRLIPFQLLFPSNDTNITFPIGGQFITMPDGTQEWLPSPTVTIPQQSDTLGTIKNDFSKQAIAQLTACGLSIPSDPELGERLLTATTEPESEPLPIFEFLRNLVLIWLSIGAFAIIPLIVFCFKATSKKALIKQMNQGTVFLMSLNHLLPVQIAGQSIHISSHGVLDYLRNANGPFELRYPIALQEKTPVITLYEDKVKTRQYVLQTDEHENFEGKYFLSSIRIYIQGDPATPVMQLDGFISDTPEERAITTSDIGYRMEGHFLAMGGHTAIKRREMNRGQDLPMKGLKYPGYTTPSNIRLVGICPKCGKSFTFHGYAFYMAQSDVAYSDDGLDCCVIESYGIDPNTWSYTEDGKTFRYYNPFCCPHCNEPYIDYKAHPENKIFGVSGCVHLGRKHYHFK